MNRMPRLAAGLTLVELMVVVAIVGVIASVATVSMRESPTPKGARQVQLVFAEARRMALTGGPLRPDVRTALGERARTRVDVSRLVGMEQLELLVFVEDPTLPSGVWEIVQTTVLPPNVQVVGVADAMQTQPGGPAPPALPGGAPVMKRCYPDGTCDGATVFLSDRRKDPGVEDPYRVVVAPLTGVSAVSKGW